MQIERIEDKKFMLSITEKEALNFADDSNHDFLNRKLIVLRLGNRLFDYICESCKFPHDKRPMVELEL